MISDLNQIIRRKHFDNFIKDGNCNMRYGVSDKVSSDAKIMIENDELKERLIVLKNQLNFLGVEGGCKKVYDESEVKRAKDGLEKIKEFSATLNFKKDNLKVLLDDSLAKLNISQAVKIKTELNQLDKELKAAQEKESENLLIISNDNLDYENQMIKIKDKYDDIDIISHEIVDNEFSGSVIADYKKLRASQLVSQFLDSLTKEKQEQILNENENLRGYLNVGENI